MDTVNKSIQISAEGLEALKKELNELITVKRPVIVARLENARQEGDLSENADYSNAKDELEFLDGRIDELTRVVNNATVAADPANGKSNGQVALGTKVKVVLNDKEHDFEIVGDWEADPMSKKISYESPLGQALVGKKAGDDVEVEAPAGKIIYKIISVS